MPNTNSPRSANAHRLIRRKQVELAIGLSRSTIYARLDPKSPHYDSDFPKPISLGSMSVAWVEAEIQSWIASRIAASRKEGVADASRKTIVARCKAHNTNTSAMNKKTSSCNADLEENSCGDCARQSRGSHD